MKLLLCGEWWVPTAKRIFLLRHRKVEKEHYEFCSMGHLICSTINQTSQFWAIFLLLFHSISSFPTCICCIKHCIVCTGQTQIFPPSLLSFNPRQRLLASWKGFCSFSEKLIFSPLQYHFWVGKKQLHIITDYVLFLVSFLPTLSQQPYSEFLITHVAPPSPLASFSLQAAGSGKNFWCCKKPASSLFPLFYSTKPLSLFLSREFFSML